MFRTKGMQWFISGCSLQWLGSSVGNKTQWLVKLCHPYPLPQHALQSRSEVPHKRTEHQINVPGSILQPRHHLHGLHTLLQEPFLQLTNHMFQVWWAVVLLRQQERVHPKWVEPKVSPTEYCRVQCSCDLKIAPDVFSRPTLTRGPV